RPRGHVPRPACPPGRAPGRGRSLPPPSSATRSRSSPRPVPRTSPPACARSPVWFPGPPRLAGGLGVVLLPAEVGHAAPGLVELDLAGGEESPGHVRAGLPRVAVLERLVDGPPPLGRLPLL